MVYWLHLVAVHAVEQEIITQHSTHAAMVCWHHLVDVHAVEKEILTQHLTRAVLEDRVHQVVKLAVEGELTIEYSATAAMVVFVNLHYVLSWHCYNIYVYFCKYLI